MLATKLIGTFVEFLEWEVDEKTGTGDAIILV